MTSAQESGGAAVAGPVCGGPGQGPLDTLLCHVTEGLPWTGVALAVLVLVLVAGVMVRRRAQARRASLPLLVFPTSAPAPGGSAEGTRSATGAAKKRDAKAPAAPEGGKRAPRQVEGETHGPAGAPGARRGSAEGSGPEGVAPTARSRKGKGKRKKREDRRDQAAAPADEAAAPADATASPSAAAPAPPPASPSEELLSEGTLQLLPGWLERVSGDAPSNEIRFVRVPGAAPEVTFGRQPGPEFRHVQLRSLAVSRLQARMILDEGGWLIRNESGTNPTRVNGTSLDSASGDVRLGEGDRIEMGDVTFIFHGAQGRDTLAARSGWHSAQGPRPTNQDAAVVRRLGEAREVAAVCDGMGSHRAGGRASHAALEALVAGLEGGESLEDAVASAQRAVRSVAMEEAEPDGVGTTLVAVHREGSTYRVVNVGDSRAYRFRGGRLERLTRDHSFVEEAVRSGRMTEEEARRSPLRNAVTRSLGESPAAEAEYFGPFEVERGTLLLLSSDGFHGVLDDTDIAVLLGEDLPTPDRPRRLVRAALEAGTRDNVSVVVLAFA